MVVVAFGLALSLALSAAPGPRTALLVRATMHDERSGGLVLLGYLLGDAVFAGIAFAAAVLARPFPLIVSAGLLAAIALLLALLALHHRGRVLLVDAPVTLDRPFASSLAQSLRNAGLLIDAILPFGAVAASLAMPEVVCFLLGGLIGAAVWFGANYGASLRKPLAGTPALVRGLCAARGTLLGLVAVGFAFQVLRGTGAAA